MHAANKNDKADYRSKVGPIPPENWDNDLPFDPDAVDKLPGSIYDEITQRIEKIQSDKKKNAAKPK